LIIFGSAMNTVRMKEALLIISILFICQIGKAGTTNQDTVMMTNGHLIIGEIKIFENGVLKMETDYSDNDFEIEWKNVKGIRSNTEFIITLSNNLRTLGTLASDPYDENYFIIYPENGSKMFALRTDIIFLKSLESGFWDRISANIDGGVSITKASNTTQVSLSGKVSYLYKIISSDIYVDWLKNIVQDTIRTDRSNYGTNWRVFFTKNYFVLGASDFFSSDEQNLELRTTLKLGLGRYLVRKDNYYFSAALGADSNHEIFKTEDLGNNQSGEVFGELEFNAFAIKNLDFTTKIEYYQGVSDRGRNRVNYSLDIKWDLPKDFYIGAGLTMNYDNQPSQGASSLDYVINNSIGWKF